MTNELLRNKNYLNVWSILVDHPEARDCDRTLYRLYYKKYFEKFCNTDRPVPLQNQIAKWRQRVQILDYSLRPSKEVQERRKKAGNYYARGAV